MKVYKDDRGDNDLELQIERLKLRVRDLEKINDKHKKLNGKLRKELEDVREALARVSGPVH
jgi:predicted RNase H-like nuclease (RuvC/YqgF family)